MASLYVLMFKLATSCWFFVDIVSCPEFRSSSAVIDCGPLQSEKEGKEMIQSEPAIWGRGFCEDESALDTW